jgi:protein-disulfide isomerase
VQTGPLLDEAYASTGKVVNVFRNFPLPIHPNAVPAAKAAYCVGQQDPKFFWTLHDWLFANQNTWAGAQDAADQIRKQALAIGADGAKYDACLTDAKTEAVIQRDLKDGAAQGVSGTPAFFVVKNTAQGQAATPKFISGAVPFEQFKQAIEQVMAGQ